MELKKAKEWFEEDNMMTAVFAKVIEATASCVHYGKWQHLGEDYFLLENSEGFAIAGPSGGNSSRTIICNFNYL